jgi:hypothetical protein
LLCVTFASAALNALLLLLVLYFEGSGLQGSKNAIPLRVALEPAAKPATELVVLELRETSDTELELAKGDLKFSVIRKLDTSPSPSDEPSADVPEAAVKVQDSEAGEYGLAENTETLEASSGEPPDVGLPEGVAPMLQVDSQTRAVKIGNYSSVTIDGDPSECTALGHSLLSNAGDNNGSLEVLVETNEIVMARICASNGTVILTCRQNKITISPRKARPSDACGVTAALKHG